MAVYTQVSSETISDFLCGFEVGALVSVKGIAEGVENSNYMLVTTKSQFILTLFEKRVNPADLPFFFGLMNHLASKNMPVPQVIANRAGAILHQLAGKNACLIEFFLGVSVTEPTPEHCYEVGSTLAKLRLASAGFTGRRTNDLSLDGWKQLAAQCRSSASKPNIDDIEPGLGALVADSLRDITLDWPRSLPQSAIHADLFPDNVLFMGSQISGVIDFYFACTDIAVYDLAVCLNAWCFDASGKLPWHENANALMAGYEAVMPLSPEERRALPIVSIGAALRFLLTRSYDWLHTPPGALVTRKDPLAYAHRLRFYRTAHL